MHARHSYIEALKLMCGNFNSELLWSLAVALQYLLPDCPTLLAPVDDDRFSKEQNGLADHDCLPQVLGVFLRARSSACLVVVMLQIGLHQPGSVMRFEDEGTHE